MYDIFLDSGYQTTNTTSDEATPGELDLSDWQIGETLEFDFDFDIGLSPEPAMVPKKSNGCTCKQCQEICPYAEKNQSDGSFICYSCRLIM